jgi:glucokinase
MILAGDIGATKTLLALVDQKSSQSVIEKIYPSQNYARFEDLLIDFKAVIADLLKNSPLTAAGFGVAGPVVGERCETTNLPWIITVSGLRELLGCQRVFLINDLEAVGYAIPLLSQQELSPLNPNASQSNGHAALIAAGTGLGEALLYWDGKRFRVMASEGGNVDFAPRNELQIELLRYWQAQLPYVSYEHLSSGPGLLRIYQFLRAKGYGQEPAWLSQRLQEEDPSAVIAQVALAKENELCMQALEQFVLIYGAEAGNLALKAMALGGIYLGGGIAPKILPKLHEGSFMQAFIDKGPFTHLLSSIPVQVILNPKAGLLGAIKIANLNGGVQSEALHHFNGE